MRSSTQILALAASATSVAAGAIQGMNIGALTSENVIRDQANFQTNFATAKNLAGTNHAFNSARLYTMIQGGTVNTPTEAIAAAIAEKTTLLLGLWTSGTTFEDELAALKSAIATYGDKLSGLITGISVGSEDLYRNSPTGIAATAGIGQEPDVIVDYITKVRRAISGTAIADVGVGHVDTWTAWVNGSNSEVIKNCDWLGFDGYPYWQTTDSNSVDNGKALFIESYEKVVAAAGSKDVWVTETGWAVTDAKGGEGDSVASAKDAKIYWDDVGCDYLFGKVNTYWYMLEDASSTPSFGVSDSESNTTPLYDLSCSAKTSKTSTRSSTATSATKSGLSTSTTVKATPSSSISAALHSISTVAASQIASLSSMAATATGSVKSSILAQQTSLAAAASAAESSIAVEVSSVANQTVVGVTATATSTPVSGSGTSGSDAGSAAAGATSVPSSISTVSGAGMKVASIGGVFAAGLLAVLVL